jgi:diguanylate cyclase (GGDEF)-like protein/PAS domain S-box-containing protein
MWVFDLETLAFLEVNVAAIAHYGYSREEFLARRISDLRPDGDVSRIVDAIEQKRSLAHGTGAARHRLKDGRIIEVEASGHHLTFQGREAGLVAIQDVTEQKRLETELRHQAFHDSLTDLANRALFADRIDQAIRRHRRDDRFGAVLLIDLDRFKTVNDSLGHTVGDALLVHFAQLIEGTLRAADTAARLGGDEFGVLLEDIDDVEDAANAAERILDALKEPIDLDGVEVFVHASIGVTITGIDGQSAEELLRNADAAMYGAKADGRGRMRAYEPEMHQAALNRLELEADLRRAVAANELVVHYQPIVSIAERKVSALEALVRWHHPVRGLVLPNEFIPVAEDTGLIVDIGRFVLREACREASEWRRAGNEFTIAVNLSARQLSAVDLVSDVANVLETTGLLPSALTLEITESVLIKDPETAVRRLRELKALGVRLAIDDFGTGYSSLSSLRALPVDSLKIDKTFIDGLSDGAEAIGVVHAIIRLARTLNLDTVAEGVEHGAQFDELEALGCRQFQGFCFSKPVPSDEVPDLFARPVELLAPAE